MAEEVKETKEVKKTTRKSSTKKEAKEVEKIEEVPAMDLQAQMQQMMAIMMAQQQQIADLMASQNQPRAVASTEDVKVERSTKRTRKDRGMTKQDLRRKYKDVDIYLTNISQGIVQYDGKVYSYHWENPGDSEPVSIDDIINMPDRYLHEPWLVIDEYENAEEIVDDIVNVLKLAPIYEYIHIIQDMEEDINTVTIEEVQKAVKLSKARGYSLEMDLVVLVNRKINNKELTNYRFIAELGEALGRKFI